MTVCTTLNDSVLMTTQTKREPHAARLHISGFHEKNDTEAANTNSCDEDSNTTFQ